MDSRLLISPVLWWSSLAGCSASEPLTLHSLVVPGVVHTEWPKPSQERPDPTHPSEDGPSTTLSIAAPSGMYTNATAQATFVTYEPPSLSAPSDLFLYPSNLLKNSVTLHDQPIPKNTRRLLPRRMVGTRTGR